ncbi:MAG: N,N-dimethylformamidase beta subunit family domain-containing protein, partial [Pseudomonadota bacterium]|nr:N,N-dimethylformamidase beta subunit family domain-containing protein [Pseudomonadota bacterium]
MAEVKLFGYCNNISVRPGDEQTFHVTADGTDTAEAQLVRLIHGDQHPDGPGFIEEEVDCEINGAWQVKKQYTQVGSYLQVPDPENRLCIDGSFSMFAYIWPSLHPKVGAQAVCGRYDDFNSIGYGFGIDETGHLGFIVADGKEFDAVISEIPLQRHIWYFIGASYDASTGRATLHQVGVVNRYNSLWGKVTPMDYDSHVSETLRFKPKHAPDISFLVGGTWDFHVNRGKFVNELYSGKVDRPGIVSRVLSREEFDHICSGGKPPENDILAYWDTSAGYTDTGIGDSVTDTGPYGLHAIGINKPVRAQTGWNWNGRNDCFRLAPEEYGGIEFHDDAIIDCGWDVTHRLTIPENLKSGVYAIRLRAGDATGLGEEYLVFFVRATTPRAPIALLIPTASYLAYANDHLTFDAQMAQPIVGQTPIVSDIDIEVYQSPEFGLSTYDHHQDGAGVCYSSYRRPIVSLQPKYRNPMNGVTWQFPADLSIVAWLEHCNYDYEVLTDEDLHTEGVDAISPYKCVITGTHPEYYSETMLDATEDFVVGGGRLIYMGGNGYYWNVDFCKDEPWCMEVRKLDSGMRA